jgi:outer membrane protein assembly factor BamB
MRTVLVVLAVACSSVAVVAGENWPQYRGPNGDGCSDARGLPVKWSETENVRWKTAIHDKGWSSPVVWGDQIWMTTATADGKDLFAVCVDRASGKILHDLKIFTVDQPQKSIDFNSYASPTPVIEAGRVYVHFGYAGTACLDTSNGKVLWERRDLPCNHWRGPASSPIIYKDLLFLVFDGHDVQYVAALDKKTGATVWKKDRTIKYVSDDGDIKKAFATPQVIEVGGKPQLVSPAAEATITYDPATGDEVWRVIHGGMNEAGRPLYGHGLVFLTNGHKKKLFAVDPTSTGDLTNTNVRWTFAKEVPSQPSLLLVDDLIFMVSDGDMASCLEAKTGKLVWSERLKGPAAFSSSPLYADGKIYLSTREGNTHVLEAGRTFKVLAINALADGCMASPAVVGKSLLLRTKTHLYCLEQK